MTTVGVKWFMSLITSQLVTLPVLELIVSFRRSPWKRLADSQAPSGERE